MQIILRPADFAAKLIRLFRQKADAVKAGIRFQGDGYFFVCSACSIPEERKLPEAAERQGQVMLHCIRDLKVQREAHHQNLPADPRLPELHPFRNVGDRKRVYSLRLTAKVCQPHGPQAVGIALQNRNQLLFRADLFLNVMYIVFDSLQINLQIGICFHESCCFRVK